MEFDKKNFKSVMSINIGPNAALAVQKSGASELDKRKFYNSALDFLVAMTQKIMERCPLKYPLTRAISCLNPAIITASSYDANRRMDSLLKILLEKKRISSAVVDRVQLQYQLMTANAENLCSIKDFSFYHDSLDKLYFSLIGS